MSLEHLPSWESGTSWLCHLQSSDFEFWGSLVGKDFPSDVGIVVVNDFGNLEILLIILWKFAEMLMFANCWGANKIWSASIVAGVFSLQNWGWLVERVFFCFPEHVIGEHHIFTIWERFELTKFHNKCLLMLYFNHSSLWFFGPLIVWGYFEFSCADAEKIIDFCSVLRSTTNCTSCKIECYPRWTHMKVLCAALMCTDR